jgi:hypothetical protein
LFQEKRRNYKIYEDSTKAALEVMELQRAALQRKEEQIREDTEKTKVIMIYTLQY